MGYRQGWGGCGFFFYINDKSIIPNKLFLKYLEISAQCVGSLLVSWPCCSGELCGSWVLCFYLNKKQQEVRSKKINGAALI